MFGWFSKGSVPEPAMIEWIFDSYAFLLENTGGTQAFADTELVLPTPEFYPVDASLEGHDFACQMFEQTQHHAGLQNWPCELVPHEDAASPRDLMGRALLGSTESNGTAGTFSVEAGRTNRVRISYSPRSLNDPEALVATFAHELAHYLIASFPRADVPGGPEAEEPLTDVGAVFLGFGVFSANSSFNFRQFQDAARQGWEIKQLGYLGERELAYALGVFLALMGRAPDAALRNLRDNPRSYLKRAVRDIQKNRGEEMARLRAITGDAKPDVPVSEAG